MESIALSLSTTTTMKTAFPSLLSMTNRQNESVSFVFFFSGVFKEQTAREI
jgi:hypothetical protein